jgi:hypothetical protein
LLWEAKEWMESASLLMASTSPLTPCLLISVFDSSIFSLLSCKLRSSLCRLSSLSSLAWRASAMMEALLDMALPTSFPPLPVPSPPLPLPLLLLFAGESECSLVSKSELSRISKSYLEPNQTNQY